jgi:hypothetical protein
MLVLADVVMPGLPVELQTQFYQHTKIAER